MPIDSGSKCVKKAALQQFSPWENGLREAFSNKHLEETSQAVRHFSLCCVEEHNIYGCVFSHCSVHVTHARLSGEWKKREITHPVPTFIMSSGGRNCVRCEKHRQRGDQVVPFIFLQCLRLKCSFSFVSTVCISVCDQKALSQCVAQIKAIDDLKWLGRSMPAGRSSNRAPESHRSC